MDKGLKNEVNNIMNNGIEVESTNLHLSENQVPKFNKAKVLKCSVLFVDIRHSTKITDEIGAKNIIKIYQSFTRIVIKSVEDNCGYVEQIMGDGLLCIFDNKNGYPSGHNAINAALNILDYVNNTYNKIVSEEFEIGCGIGIRTGHIFITKIGLKGNGKCSKVAYPSYITNYAAKMCDLARENQIIVDKKTFYEYKGNIFFTQFNKLPTMLNNIDDDCYYYNY